MTVTINAVSGTGVVTTSDGSGIVKLQSNSVTTNALAWVNFNGTGTVAIRSSYNVSSITDNGTGDYTVNFTTALSDANYSASVTSGGSTTTDRTILGTAYALATGSVKVNAAICTNATYYDPTIMSVAIFGN